MKNENIHAYSWAEQQRRARRDRMFECMRGRLHVAIILIGWVGIPAFFVVVGLWNIIKMMAQ